MDNIFKEGLQDHRIAPSDAVWSRVESTLDQKEEKKGFYWYVAIAAALIILFSFSALIRWNIGETGTEGVMDQMVEQPQEDVLESEEKEELKIDKVETDKAPETMIAQQQAPEEEAVPAPQRSYHEEPLQLAMVETPDLPEARVERQPDLEGYFIYDMASLQGRYTLHEDETAFGEQVISYTKDQLMNWANGERIELPKPKLKKPKLDVDWNKLFASGK